MTGNKKSLLLRAILYLGLCGPGLGYAQSGIVQTVGLQKDNHLLFELWAVIAIGGVIFAITVVLFLALIRSHRMLSATHNELQQLRAKRQAILDAIPDFLFEFGLDGTYYEVHAGRQELLSAPIRELIGNKISDFMPTPAVETYLSALQEALENGSSFGKQIELPRAQGYLWFELSVTRKSVKPGEDPRFIVISRKITDRKHAEQQQKRLTRAFLLLSQCNLMLMDAEDEQELLNGICRLAVEAGGYRMAWVGLVEHDAAKSVRVASKFADKHNYSELAVVTWDESMSGQGPTGTAIRTGKTVVNQNCLMNPKMELWREEALRCGYRSSISIPLILKNQTLGVVSIYSADVFAFGSEETSLLEELVDNLAYGIENLQAKQMLVASYELLKTVLENTPVRVFWKDTELRFLGCNTAFARDAGMKHPEEVVGKSDFEMSWYSQADLYRRDDQKVIETGEVILNREEPQTTTDGRLIWLRTSKVPLRTPDGQIFGMLGIYDDITEHQLAAQQQKRLSRAFQLLSKCNLMLMNTEDEQVLLNGVCRLAVEIGGYKMAWVGFAEHDDAKTVQVVTKYGDVSGYLDDTTITWDESERGRGPVGIAIRTGKTSVNQNYQTDPKMVMWRAIAIKCGYQASIAIPLVLNNRVRGVFCAYSSDVFAFGPEETSLLEEFVGNFVYGIENLRARQEHLRQVEQERIYLQILELLAHGRSLDEILHFVAMYVECFYPGALVSIMLVDQAGGCLVSAAAPSLPADFVEAVRQIPIGDGVGSCGTAAWRGDTVVVDNVQTHPYWVKFKHIVENTELRSCWSQPIYDSMGEVLGTFGIYTHSSFSPTEAEREVVHRASHLAAVAIERHRAEDQLSSREMEFRTLVENAPSIILRYDRQGCRTYVNPAFEREFGYSSEEALNTSPEELWCGGNLMSPEEFRALMERVMTTGEPVDFILDNICVGTELQYYAWRVVAERGIDNQVIGVLAMGYNITSLKKTEQRLEESRNQLRELAALRESARDEERRLVAREIHDELGQVLSALRLGISTMRMQFGKDNPQLVERVGNLLSLSDRSIQVVRDVAYSLRPAALDMGVISALEWLAAEFQRHVGISCRLHLPPSEVAMGEVLAMTIFRIVQEGLTNITRYAEASQVEIRLGYTHTNCNLELRDNGKGFNLSEVGSKSFGLLGMRERVALVDGQVDIISAPGKGTLIKVTIPLFGEATTD